ncbi:MAG: helix-turn-helix domain-containing protein [Desulfitobacterium sp.]
MGIGEKLKKLRNDKGLTLRELSEITGVSISFISDIENNRRNPSVEYLQKLAHGLDVPTADLLLEANYVLTPINIGATTTRARGYRRLPTEVRETSTRRYDVTKNEVTELLDTLHKRPELRALFSLSKNASKEDIEKAIKIIEALKDDE